MTNAIKERAVRSTLEYDSEHSKPISYDDIILAVFYLTSIVAVISGGIYFMSLNNPQPQSLVSLSIIGGGGVIATSFISMFKKKIGFIFASIIAVFQGLMIGGLIVAVSLMQFKSGIRPETLIVQAIVGVLGATIACCLAYHFKIIRVTSTFRKVSFILGMGFFFTYLINFILNVFFHTGMNMYGGGALNIVIGVIAIIAASMSLIRSLDDCNNLVINGAPKAARWGLGAASGVTNSIVWLFMEIMRILININRT